MKATKVNKKILGLGRVLEVWQSSTKSDVEGYGWRWGAAILKGGIFTNLKTVTTYTDHPHKSELD